MIVGILLAALLGTTLAPMAHAEPSRAGNQLSARTQLRYQDVLTTRSGSRWRGRIIERGEVFRIRLDDNSEVAVEKAEVASVTRELHPGYPHNGQWSARVGAGAEIAFITATTNAGLTTGPYLEVALARNFGGGFEPEIVVALTPIGPADGAFTPEIGLGARYYLQPNKRAKPFTHTQIILYGLAGDLGLRTGPGFLLDLSPNFSLGAAQGVTLMTQVNDEGAVGAAIGYHFTVQAQGRF
ncbi:MAG: hypothetical protein Q8P41_04830 [Pseudomonadota bacterium]|nr:hypothetical protein [Pseudomonadota bacterium]